MRALLTDFLSDCKRRRGLAATTLAGYSQSCTGWMDWIEQSDCGLAALSDWTTDNARAYDSCERRRGIRQSTLRSRIAALRVWGAWLIERGHVAGNPWMEIRTPLSEELRQPCPSAEQVRAMIDACDRIPNYERSRMTKAALVLLSLCGLRLSEMCALRVADVTLSGNRRCLTVRYGKGGKQRFPPLNSVAAAVLTDWLSIRPQSTLPNLLLLHGKRLGDRPYSACAFNAALALVKALAGIRDADITAHALRRFAATSIAQQKGASIADAQRFLGHSSLHTTLAYIRPTSRLDALAEGILPPIPPERTDNRIRPEPCRRKPGWRRM